MKTVWEYSRILFNILKKLKSDKILKKFKNGILFGSSKKKQKQNDTWVVCSKFLKAPQKMKISKSKNV